MDDHHAVFQDDPFHIIIIGGSITSRMLLPTVRFEAPHCEPDLCDTRWWRCKTIPCCICSNAFVMFVLMYLLCSCNCCILLIYGNRIYQTKEQHILHSILICWCFAFYDQIIFVFVFVFVLLSSFVSLFDYKKTVIMMYSAWDVQ